MECHWVVSAILPIACHRYFKKSFQVEWRFVSLLFPCYCSRRCLLNKPVSYPTDQKLLMDAVTRCNLVFSQKYIATFWPNQHSFKPP